MSPAATIDRTQPIPMETPGLYICHVCGKKCASFDRNGERFLINHRRPRKYDSRNCSGSEAIVPVSASKSVMAEYFKVDW